MCLWHIVAGQDVVEVLFYARDGLLEERAPARAALFGWSGHYCGIGRRKL